jgi:hypothetical protein
MIQHTYNIDHFDWDKEANTFYGIGDKLFECERNHFYQLPFINGRGQFFIKNKRTDGFRRFRFERQCDISETEVVYMYNSEDGIKCEVIVKKD